MWHLLSGGKRVDIEKAKAILQHYRPLIDAAEPYFSEALEQVQHDPALAQWFTKHCTSYEAVRRTLRQTPVPAGLREAILQAHARRRPVRWWTQPALVAPAVAAVIIVLAVIGYALSGYRSAVTQPRHFTAYLQTITRLAAGRYTMAVATADPDVLRHHLATAHGPTDYALPPGLRVLRLEGGLVIEWFGDKVSMLCFTQEDEEPQAKETNDDHDAWLFVVSRDALPDGPASDVPRFAPVQGLITASWTRGDMTYVLAMRGTQAQLEQLL
jgi:hypothetical protein